MAFAGYHSNVRLTDDGQICAELPGITDYEQTTGLANILDNGPLPASVRTTEQTTVNPK